MSNKGVTITGQELYSSHATVTGLEFDKRMGLIRVRAGEMEFLVRPELAPSIGDRIRWAFCLDRSDPSVRRLSIGAELGSEVAAA